MRPLPVNDATLTLARRCVWYKPPAEALGNPLHLAAHVMAHGMPRDVAILREHIGDEGLIEVLRNAPPGILDARSWWYWHLVLLDESPPPPMPERRLTPPARR
jgi:hypothetical protein